MQVLLLFLLLLLKPPPFSFTAFVSEYWVDVHQLPLMLFCLVLNSPIFIGGSK